MKELLDAITRLGGIIPVATALGIPAYRVRIWKSRKSVPQPWPRLLAKLKPKKTKAVV